MTTGSTNLNYNVASNPQYRSDMQQLVAPFEYRTGTWANQGASFARNVNTKVWSGTDRVKYVETTAEKESRRRFYTVPVTVDRVSRRGKVTQKVILKRKSFLTKPRPNRVKSDVENAPHAYTMTKDIIRDGPLTGESSYVSGSWRYITKLRDDTCYRRSLIPNFSNVDFTANENLKLINKLKSRLRGSDFDLSVFIGEGQETLKMLASQMSRIAEAGWYTRKGNVKQALKILAAGRSGYSPSVSKMPFKAKEAAQKARDPLARSWLELQYGLIPMLSDVKAGAEQLSHILHYPKTKKYTAKTEYAIALNTGSTRWSETDLRKSKRISAYVTEPENLAKISGFMDPENVAWELVPFSFVADWVVPIGDYLSARAFASKLKATYVTTLTTKGHVKGVLGSTLSNQTYGSNTHGREYLSSARTISTVLDVPYPAVKKLSEVFSWMHVANGVALVQAVFSGSRKVKKAEIDRYTTSTKEFLNGVRQTRQSFRNDAKTFL